MQSFAMQSWHRRFGKAAEHRILRRSGLSPRRPFRNGCNKAFVNWYVSGYPVVRPVVPHDTILSIMKSSFALLLLCVAAWGAPKSSALDIYFIDTEGGQATLFVSPSGESMLVDTGWPGFEGRDAKRIAAAAKVAGVTQIDYLVITHYHVDHAGGVPQLAALLPIKHFVDHGASFEHGANEDKLYEAYIKTRAAGEHLEVKAGDTIPVRGLTVKVLSAGGGLMAGKGEANPFCEGTKPRDMDPTENARSVGTLITYGKFRIVDLGDLTWNKEFELVCPQNRIGTVDVYLTTHHGMNMSGPEAIVHALHPKVAIMNNGAKKGGTPEAWKAVHSSPGLKDMWQLHTSVAGGTESNVDEQLIANPSQDGDAGNYIKLSAHADGKFTVTNSRNGVSRSY